jgi:hypothetical protein
MRFAQEKSVIAALRTTITNLSPGRTELHLGKFSLIAAARDGNDFLQAVIHIPAMNGEEARTFAARRVRFGFTGDEMIIYLDQARISHGTLDIISESPTFRIDLKELQKGSEKRFTGLRYQTSTAIFQQLEDPKSCSSRCTSAERSPPSISSSCSSACRSACCSGGARSSARSPSRSAWRSCTTCSRCDWGSSWR